MKKMFLAAGIGLSLITATMAMSTNNYAAPQGAGVIRDTVPEKDTTDPKPKPDSTSFTIRVK